MGIFLSRATINTATMMLRWLVLCDAVALSGAWSTPSSSSSSYQFSFGGVDARRWSSSFSSSGEGGEASWAEALKEAEGSGPGAFEREMKMRGLGGGGGGAGGPAARRRTANGALLAWLEEEGDVYLRDASTWGTAPHPLAISTETADEATNESTGRGLLARRNVNEGDELLTIPMSMCLTIGTARETLGADVITDGMNEYLALAALLVHERYARGDGGPWRAYLGVLPEVDEVNPTFTWSDEDLAFLDGSPVVAATLSLRNKLEREFEALFEGDDGLLARFPDRFSSDHFTLENWTWAFTMLFSRAIRLRSLRDGEALAMVPYADLINHSPFSGAYVDAREVGDWLVKTGEEEVILYAERGYRKMEQVFISYGPKSNAELLLLYGFALEKNPFNSVDVTVSLAPLTKARAAALSKEETQIAPDPLAEEKLEFLEERGRRNTVDFPCYADRYPTEMLEYLRLVQMTEEDSGGRPLRDFDYSRTISAANEAAVLTSVVDAVRRQLERYPNTEEQDAALISDKGMFRLFSYNQRMAVRHRRNEKRLLKRTVAALERQIKTRGLNAPDLRRAGGSTAGQILPGEENYGKNERRSALEERLDRMGLPVDLR